MGSARTYAVDNQDVPMSSSAGFMAAIIAIVIGVIAFTVALTALILVLLLRSSVSTSSGRVDPLHARKDIE